MSFAPLHAINCIQQNVCASLYSKWNNGSVIKWACRNMDYAIILCKRRTYNNIIQQTAKRYHPYAARTHQKWLTPNVDWKYLWAIIDKMDNGFTKTYPLNYCIKPQKLFVAGFKFMSRYNVVCWAKCLYYGYLLYLKQTWLAAYCIGEMAKWSF